MGVGHLFMALFGFGGVLGLGAKDSHDNKKAMKYQQYEWQDTNTERENELCRMSSYKLDKIVGNGKIGFILKNNTKSHYGFEFEPDEDDYFCYSVPVGESEELLRLQAIGLIAAREGWQMTPFLRKERDTLYKQDEFIKELVGKKEWEIEYEKAKKLRESNKGDDDTTE